jgi:hypothetical protein
MLQTIDPIHRFVPKYGLKTEAGALARIKSIKGLAPSSVFFVAYQEGRYFAVCSIREADRHNMFAIASSGVTVVG